MEYGNLVAARAKTKRAAIEILKGKGFQGVTVALKKNWSFQDRVTDDWHQGEFWEMEVQQEKSRKKRNLLENGKRQNLLESLRGKLAIAKAPKSNEAREE